MSTWRKTPSESQRDSTVGNIEQHCSKPSNSQDSKWNAQKKDTWILEKSLNVSLETTAKSQSVSVETRRSSTLRIRILEAFQQLPRVYEPICRATFSVPTVWSLSSNTGPGSRIAYEDPQNDVLSRVWNRFQFDLVSHLEAGTWSRRWNPRCEREPRASSPVESHYTSSRGTRYRWKLTGWPSTARTRVPPRLSNNPLRSRGAASCHRGETPPDRTGHQTWTNRRRVPRGADVRGRCCRLVVAMLFLVSSTRSFVIVSIIQISTTTLADRRPGGVARHAEGKCCMR